METDITSITRARELVHGIDIVNDRFRDNYFKRINEIKYLLYFTHDYVLHDNFFVFLRRYKSFARER